ncbi:hypothetical protein OIDMADRAFT_55795 [Oidiodendron maius Zn]|uniref:Uncharacterized protein n=1 Tax=Oidiodendron maius (strain Zn) TaxID=913774 RepID=A0A0C3DD70_OIDMZ|nr:hypothetical protein OIDMADRAFT_55795 [Oidiodendron maius Zn]
MYVPLATNEPPEPQQERRRWRELASCIQTYTIIRHFALLSLMAVLLALVVVFRSNLNFETHNCGGSPREARSLGCHYEMNSLRRVPEECYNPELDKAFEEKYSFKYYNDSHGTVEIDKEIVAQGETDYLYVNWEYHLTHCLFAFRKLYDSAVEGGVRKKLDSSVRNLQHFNHCLEIMMDRNKSLNAVQTIVTMSFESC